MEVALTFCENLVVTSGMPVFSFSIEKSTQRVNFENSILSAALDHKRNVPTKFQVYD